jgi:hypothetical protein
VFLLRLDSDGSSLVHDVSNNIAILKGHFDHSRARVGGVDIKAVVQKASLLFRWMREPALLLVLASHAASPKLADARNVVTLNPSGLKIQALEWKTGLEFGDLWNMGVRVGMVHVYVVTCRGGVCVRRGQSSV